MFKKFVLIIATLVSAAPAQAEVQPETSPAWTEVPPPAAPRILYVKRPVADLGRALKFYTGLGLKRSQDFPDATVLTFDDKGIGPQLILLHGPQYASHKSATNYPAAVFVLRDLPSVVKRLNSDGFTIPAPRIVTETTVPKVTPSRPGKPYYSISTENVSSYSVTKDPDGYPVSILGHLSVPGEPPFSPHIVYAKTATADIARAIVFYTAVGLEAAIDYYPEEEGRLFLMTFPRSELDGRTRLVINHGPIFASYKAPDDISHIVFAVPDIRATLGRLAEVGFDATQLPRTVDQGVERGHQIAFVKDHDGNVVELVQ